ncbi:hypothetical protein BLJ79_16510 [Arthrobacter sp. UCD-GKA]|nr:hypothetical protein BLJ79_16510 [Arthrobacter sp. UCD-GKA]
MRPVDANRDGPMVGTGARAGEGLVASVLADAAGSGSPSSTRFPGSAVKKVAGDLLTLPAGTFIGARGTRWDHALSCRLMLRGGRPCD